MKDYKPADLESFDVGVKSVALRLLSDIEGYVPGEFYDWSQKPNRWVKIASNWFYRGIHYSFDVETLMSVKEGIDEVKAIRHLQAIMSTQEPHPEHIISCMAYLMSLWFDIKTPTHRIVSELLDKLLAKLPTLTVSLIMPRDIYGNAFIDVFFDEQYVIVQTRHGQIGVSDGANDAVYGEGPDAMFDDVDEAIAAVVRILQEEKP